MFSQGLIYVSQPVRFVDDYEIQKAFPEAKSPRSVESEYKAQTASLQRLCTVA